MPGRSCAVAWARREHGCVDAAKDDARPRIALVTRDLAAVLADVQMTVKPAVGGHVGRDVESAAAEIGDEHAPPPQPCAERRDAARQHVLLMTVHDGGVAERAPELSGDGVGALATHVVRPEYPHAEVPNRRAPLSRPERDELGRHVIRHVARQLERVALGSADDPVLGIERRGNEMRDPDIARAFHHGVVDRLSRPRLAIPWTMPLTRASSGRR